MKYLVQGGGEVHLKQSDFLASGGEGSVYVHGTEVFKIYHKPEHMIPERKIEELARISNPSVVRPQKVLMNDKGRAVGYSMRRVVDAHPLCQLFTKAFKDRHSVTPDKVLALVQRMQAGVRDIHAAGILLVDLNEMNFLVDPSFSEVFFIDVDSYQTPSYPATALMDSVKDWHAGGCWTEGSDWFSWGVVTFQMLMGIHPFKGKHPTLKTLEDRMKADVSVFNPKVDVPRMVPSLDTIPTAYRDWYRSVFESGDRTEPPSGLSKAVTVAVKKIRGTEQIEVTMLLSFEQEVLGFVSLAGYDICFLSDWIMETNPHGQQRIVKLGRVNPHVTFGADGRPVYGYLEHGEVWAYQPGSPTPVNLKMRGKSMMSSGGRIYVHCGEHIVELEFVGNTVGSRPVANAMPEATMLFEGVVIQNMLGSWYATVFPKPHTATQFRLFELDSGKIVDAKYESGVLMVVGFKGGKYTKFVYRMRQGDPVLFWKDEDVTYAGLNFTVLSKGVCAHIDEEERLVLFSISVGSDAVKRIEDPAIQGDMRLSHRGDEVVFTRGKELLKLKMKR
jgi:hypothetical protein